MAPNEDRESAPESHFDEQPTPPTANLDAVQECLASLPSRAPHDAIEEIDKHLSILEAWAQSEGDSAAITQAEIIGLKVSRNATLPIHALPRETLTCIFLIYLEPMEWSFKDVTRLMSVCTSWRTLLEDGWMFWPTLRSSYSPQMLDLVLSRNPSGPLRVICSKNEEAPRKLDVLERAAKHSTRWCKVAFDGVISGAIKQQLQVSTPNLAELYIFNSESRLLPTGTLGLSEGRPLRHVLLHSVAIPWDTSRLRGLRSLQLSRMIWNLPSLSQLCAALSSSPGLCYLRPSVFWDFIDFMDGLDDADTSSMLLLPELSTLVLEGLSDLFMSHLLTHIQAPACRCVVASSIPIPVASDPTFNELIAPILRVSDGVTVSSNGVSISISSSPAPQVTQAVIDSILESVGIEIAFDRVERIALTKEDIQSVVNPVLTNASTRLGVVFSYYDSSFRLITASEVLRLLPSTESIVSERRVDCQDIMRYLIAEDGEAGGLPCPELESLTLNPETGAEEELIRTFLRRHQESSRGTTNSPVRPLKHLSLPQDLLNKLEIEGLLEGLEARCLD